MKKILILMLVLSLSTVAFIGCSSTEPTGTDDGMEGTEESGMLTMTPDDLAMYDGTEGMPAYIAVDGTVYDITAMPEMIDDYGVTPGTEYTMDYFEAMGDTSMFDTMMIVGYMEGYESSY